MTPELFNQIFEECFDKVRNYIYYRSSDPDLATDIAQETFTIVWEKKFRAPDNWTALLFKIAGNLYISHYRKMQSAQKHLQYRASSGLSNHTFDDVEYKELENRYMQAIASMPEKQRIVYWMSRNDQLSYKQIAENLSISQKAVEKRMNLALQYLRNILGLH